MNFYALARSKHTPEDVLHAAAQEVCKHSVRHPYEDALLARQILDARKHATQENAK